MATTSGTAAAELFPAVVEASQARVPLYLLTADRPPRLRGTGANQTIDQPDLYGGYVKGSIDLPVPSTAGQEAWWHQAAHEALQTMTGDPIGPVHLNCPFEEPLTPSSEGSPRRSRARSRSRGRARPVAELDPDEGDRLARLVSGTAELGWDADDQPGGISRVEGHFWAELLGWPGPRRAHLGREATGIVRSRRVRR